VKAYLAAFICLSRSSKFNARSAGSRKIGPAVHRMNQMPLDGYPADRAGRLAVLRGARTARPQNRRCAATDGVGASTWPNSARQIALKGCSFEVARHAASPRADFGDHGVLVSAT
jgi:hypothetical protein